MKLCEFLNEKGMKPSHFCNKVGISTTTLHNLLSGETMPSLPTAIAIFRFTHGEVAYEDMLSDSYNAEEIHHRDRPKNKKIK